MLQPTDSMTDAARLRNGISIRRAKKKRNVQNDVRIKACIEGYNRGSYSKLQFLRAISHSLGAHTESFHVTSDVSDDDNAPQQQDPQQDVTTPSSEASATDTAKQSPQSTDCCEVSLPRALA